MDAEVTDCRHTGLGDLAGLEPHDRRIACQACENRTDFRIELLAILDTGRIIGEPRVIAEIRSLQNALAEAPPFDRILNGDHDLTVAEALPRLHEHEERSRLVT